MHPKRKRSHFGCARS